jgi:hypothetical protein
VLTWQSALRQDGAIASRKNWQFAKRKIIMNAQVSLPQTSTTSSFWVKFWRVDAAFNLLAGLLMLALAPSLLEAFGMDSDYRPQMYAFGAYSLVYGLWQVYAARSGQMSRASFLAGDALTSLTGLFFLAVWLLGFEANTLGLMMLFGYGPAGILLAGIWFYASRQVD